MKLWCRSGGASGGARCGGAAVKRCGARAVGEVKRLLRSAFTSHCVTARSREGRRGNRRKLANAMRSFRRYGRINLTMHLARHRSHTQRAAHSAPNWFDRHLSNRKLSCWCRKTLPPKFLFVSRWCDFLVLRIIGILYYTCMHITRLV